MKKTILAFFLFAVIGLAIPATAEIYKYIDENGQKRWTDDLNQVPKDQWPKVQRVMPEIEEEAPVDRIASDMQEARPDTPSVAEPEVQDANQSDQGAPPSRKALIAEKSDLDTLYDLLMEERNQLALMKTEAVSANDRAELKKRVAAYNQKADAYGIRLEDFNRKVDQYNGQFRVEQSTETE